LFGKPPRAVNCDCERSGEPTLLQTVYLQNDAHVARLLEAKDGWLKTTSNTSERDVIDEAYLRTLSRRPTDAERSIALEHLNTASDAKAGLRSLLWALVNTKEFILNH
jgi:hypothetical protein